MMKIEDFAPYDSTLETITAWVLTGRPLGDFTNAVLCNDLREAFNRADDNNARRMLEIVRFCYWVLPAQAWGSERNVRAWEEQLREEPITQETLRHYPPDLQKAAVHFGVMKYIPEGTPA
jgi:hypothetical protein